jgi:mono/diheme cytochrome c family protein
MRPALTFLAGAVAAGVVAGLGGLAVIGAGAFDARASTPHDPLTAWATHTTMIHSVERRSRSVHPSAAPTSAAVRGGLRLYDQDCVGCHGAPGRARDGWTNGLNPSPPYLVDAPRHWRRAELFSIVRDGVKMTGMPAWGAVHSDPQIWEIVAFLEAQPYLSPAQYRQIGASEAALPRGTHSSH